MTDANAPRCPQCRQLLTDGQAFCSHCGAAANIPDTDPDSLRGSLQALLGADVILDAEIGRGAMGVVFAGFDVNLQRRVAVKTLLPAAESDPGIAERFIREARVAAALDHPNVVSIYSVRQGQGIRAIVMQHVDGRGLDKLLWETPLMPVPAAALLLAQIAAALQHAHDRGVVHRDIKPANVLIGYDGIALVTDFGIARKLDATRITEEGLVVGTLGYISPEGCRGEDATARSDQYSLGVVAFEMLAGRRPFRGSAAELLRLHATADAPLLADARDELPLKLTIAVQRMLARDPAARWASLREPERVFRSLVPDTATATLEVSGLTRARGRTEVAVIPAQTAVGVLRKPATQTNARADVLTAASATARTPRTAVFAVAAGVLIAAVAGVWSVLGENTPVIGESVQPDAVVEADGGPAPEAGATPSPARSSAAVPGTRAEPVVPNPAERADGTLGAETADSAFPPVQRDTAFAPPPRRDSALPPPPSAQPSATAIDARRIGNAFVTMLNQGRWRELDALERAGGDAELRDELVQLARTTRDLAAGFDRLPSAPEPRPAGFETEFIAEVAVGAAATAPRRYFVVTAVARYADGGWVLAGWRVQRAR